MEYESVSQKVLLSVESLLQNAKQFQCAHLLWHIRCPSGIQFLLKCSPVFVVSLFRLQQQHYQPLEIALANVSII
jgi:hypothetical protein